MIFDKFFAIKKCGKIGVLIFVEFGSQRWFLRKPPFFSQKIGKNHRRKLLYLP
jgi:hypothetical protein